MVVTDLPLYTIAKRIQLCWPDTVTDAGIASFWHCRLHAQGSPSDEDRVCSPIYCGCVVNIAEEAHEHVLDADFLNAIDLEEYCRKMTKEQPQFAYWATVLDLKLTILQLVYSTRIGDFTL